MTQPDDAGSKFRQADAARVRVDEPGLSAFQRYCPMDLADDAVLCRIESYLDRRATRELLWQLEADEQYPTPVLDELRALGVMQIFSPDECETAEQTRTTAAHMCALNAMVSRRDTSVAVTLSVNALALLPVYVAGTAEQLAAIHDLVSTGTFSSLLLSELSHGSNLLANQARAERGVLDDNGQFVRVSDDQPCTHYRLHGEKDLINGANEHGILVPFLRTRNLDQPVDEPIEPLQARADFTMFWLPRGPGVRSLPRWHTLPARGADISGLSFDDVVIPKNHVLGREHGGMSLAQKTLVISRGGVASLASGCLSRARDVATNYAAQRKIYGGERIASLGAISDHLMRLEALDRTVAAVALRTAAMLNAIGLGATHYTAVAKLIGSAFAEEGVREGQQVLGARALLRELPYERLMRDVVLYGVFDGTSHVMLQELSHRLVLEARRAGETTAAETTAAEPGSTATIEQVRSIYNAPLVPLYTKLRGRQPRLLMPLEQHLRALDRLVEGVSLEPVAATCDALFACVRGCDAAGRWQEDQAIRLDAALLFAQLEAIPALIELCDLDRRPSLGIRALVGGERPLDRLTYEFALSWLGSRVLAGVRSLALRADLTAGWLAADDVAELGRIDRQLMSGRREVVRNWRAILTG